MTEVRGFKDSSGNFWDTEKECKISDEKIHFKWLYQQLINYHGFGKYCTREVQEAIRLLLDKPEYLKEWLELISKYGKECSYPEELFKTTKQWWKFW